MYKTLLEDQNTIECPRVAIKDIHRVLVFDEIKFSNDLHKIKHIIVTSNSRHNFILLSIDGAVYKFDIGTKELIFSFKASAYRAMCLFDNDNKIITADS